MSRRALAAALVASGVCWAAERWAASRLIPTARASGWMLIVVVALLALLGVRKSVPFLPLGRLTAWVDVHAAAGVFAGALFLVHTGLRVPTGGLEITLFSGFALVTASGLGGLALSRVLPRRLSARGQEVLFETIPELRRRVREHADAVVLDSVGATGAGALATFHVARVRPFLDGPRHAVRHLLGSDRPRRELLSDLGALERYLSDIERSAAHELREAVTIKDDLDYHRALQSALRCWMFLHAPLAGALLLLALAHGLLAQVLAP